MEYRNEPIIESCLLCKDNNLKLHCEHCYNANEDNYDEKSYFSISIPGYNLYKQIFEQGYNRAVKNEVIPSYQKI